MTFIKLDPNLMQGLIKNLESYAMKPRGLAVISTPPV